MKTGINQKLLGSFLAGLILFLLSLGASLLVINELMHTTRELEAITRKVELTGDLRLHLHSLLTPVNNYLIGGDKGERDNFDRTLAKISGILAELKGFGGDEKWEALAKEVGGGAIGLSEKVISALFIEDPVGNRQAAVLMGEINLLSGSVIQKADEFHGLTRYEVDQRNKAAAARVDKLKIFLAIILILTLSGAFFLASYVTSSITRPILEVRKGAGIIGAGDLSHRLEVRNRDEIGELAEEFNSMASSLSLAMQGLDRKMQELATLYQVSSILSAGFEVNSLLRHIVTELAEQLGIARMSVFLADEVKARVALTVCTVTVEEGGIPSLKMGEGLIGKAALEGKTFVVDDAGREADLLETERLIVDGAGALVVIPFGTRGEISGVLTAFRKEVASFSREEVAMLTAVAEHAAIAVENASLYQKAKHISLTDSVSGLYNRSFYENTLSEEVGRAIRYQRPLALLLMDIDHFANYNDIHGHEEGDMLLRMVAGIIKAEVRSSDMAARYSGEEFAIMAPETGRRAALVMAERIRKRIEEYPFPYRELQPGGILTVSIGLAALSEDTRDSHDLLKKCEYAMSEARNAGGNRVACAMSDDPEVT